MTLVIPLLAIYAETFHATPLQATMLVSVYAACQLVSGPIIGHMSDRVGRKPMLLISQVGTFIGFIVMARAQALWMLYIARVLDGSTAGNLSLAQAYISDHTEPSQRAKSFGLIGIAFGVGFFIGPSLTGYLSAKYGIDDADLPGGSDVGDQHPVHGDAAARAAASRSTRSTIAEKALHWKTYAKYFARPGLRERLLQFLFFITSFSLFISGFALFAERRFTYQGHPFGPREIGYVFGYVGFLGIILQGGLIGRLVKRFGEAALVAAGFVALAVGYFGLGIATSFVLLMVTGTLAAFGNGVIRPALTSLITQQAGRQEQGVVLGITQSLMSMASIVSPIVAGLLIERHMLKEWAWVAAGLAAIGVALSREGPDVLRDGFGRLDRRALIRNLDRRGLPDRVHHLAGTAGNRDQLARQFRVAALRGDIHRKRREAFRRSVQRSRHRHLDVGHRRFARADRAKQVTGEAAAQRDELIFAARRAEIEAALGDASVDEDRMRANDCPRRRVVDVLDRGLECVLWLAPSLKALA